MKLEQLDQDPSGPPDTTGVSIDRTGQVGTYFYTAPEIEQGWPKIDEKVSDLLEHVAFFLMYLTPASKSCCCLAANLLFYYLSVKYYIM